MNTKQWCHSVGGDPHNQGHVYDETSGATVAVTYSDEGGQHARLIAAAPKLYAALHACVDALNVAVRFDADVFGGQHNRALDTLSLAHAALAEVTQ